MEHLNDSFDSYVWPIDHMVMVQDDMGQSHGCISASEAIMNSMAAFCNIMELPALKYTHENVFDYTRKFCDPSHIFPIKACFNPLCSVLCKMFDGSFDIGASEPMRYGGSLNRFGNPVVKIRRSRDRLILIMEILILLRQHLVLDRGGRFQRTID